MNKKILIWIKRIFLWTIFQSLISIVGFVSLYYGMEVVIEKGLLDWQVQAGFISAIIALTYLQIANILYYLGGINILKNE